MRNIEYKRVGDKLVLTIDIGKASLEAAQPSASGKNKTVASTHGNTQIEGVTIGVNCYVKA